MPRMARPDMNASKDNGLGLLAFCSVCSFCNSFFAVSETGRDRDNQDRWRRACCKDIVLTRFVERRYQWICYWVLLKNNCGSYRSQHRVSSGKYNPYKDRFSLSDNDLSGRHRMGTTSSRFRNYAMLFATRALKER